MFQANNKIYTLTIYDNSLKLYIYLQILLLDAGIEEPEVADVPAFAPVIKEQYRLDVSNISATIRLSIQGGQSVFGAKG